MAFTIVKKKKTRKYNISILKNNIKMVLHKTSNIIITDIFDRAYNYHLLLFLR